MSNKLISLDVFIENLEKEISSDDIIYMCRKFLSKNRNKDHEENEEKILSIIQSKEWDWYYREYGMDINSNIIITYPVLYGSKKIVSYLLKKYDVKEFNETLSGALESSILLNNGSMLDLFLKNGLNEKYIDNLLIKALDKASHSKDDCVDAYLKLAHRLINQSNFERVLKKGIKNMSEKTFDYLIFNHPLSGDKKIKIAKDIMDNSLSENTLLIKELVGKFELFNELNKMPKSSAKINKGKI